MAKEKLMDKDPGFEYLDPTPIALPVHFVRPPSIQEDIRRFVREEFSRAAAAHGMESFAEADDFGSWDQDDEDLEPTPHEILAYEAAQASVPEFLKAIRKGKESGEFKVGDATSALPGARPGETATTPQAAAQAAQGASGDAEVDNKGD